MRRISIHTVVAGVLSTFMLSLPVAAQDADAAGEARSPAQIHRLTVQRAIGYLRSAQAPDGSYSAQVGPAITALITTGLLENGLSPDDPFVARSLKFIEKHVRKDGGIYKEGSHYQNYDTSLAVLALSKANRDGRYDKVLEGAEAFLKGIQWDEKEGYDESDPGYGGAGYGSHNRPDLSNTQYFVDALVAMGNGPDDPALQKALAFISRCQNLETEHNTTKWAAKNPDGGFYYTAAAGGSSQAGETPEGGLRSYGSMTYAGLKTMIYAGVGPDDERVKAAFNWVKQHYTLKENPGMGNAGLYFYYHTFAKALDAIGEETIASADGTVHHWKHELINTLADEQNENGSWTNKNPRWLEGDPNLVTGYALLTLAYCD